MNLRYLGYHLFPFLQPSVALDKKIEFGQTNMKRIAHGNLLKAQKEIQGLRERAIRCPRF